MPAANSLLNKAVARIASAPTLPFSFLEDGIESKVLWAVRTSLMCLAPTHRADLDLAVCALLVAMSQCGRGYPFGTFRIRTIPAFASGMCVFGGLQFIGIAFIGVEVVENGF